MPNTPVQINRHIISASRKTDIPAFYAEWFMNRIRAGYCHWLNPYTDQVHRIELTPETCLAIVFWTRHATPLLPYLDELTARGFKYYFHFTLLGYPTPLETHAPPLEAAVRAFRTLSERVTPDRVFWKYDPIVVSNLTPLTYHLDRFGSIAEQLAGYTQRCAYAWLILFEHIRQSLAQIAPAEPLTLQTPSSAERHLFLSQLLELARAHGMQLHSCFSEDYLSVPGIQAGSCVDIEVLRRLTGDPQLEISSAGSMSYALGYRPQRHLSFAAVRRQLIKVQRRLSGVPALGHCRCRAAIDIGCEDTCLFGCTYCLATHSRTEALAHYQVHDPADTLLLRPAHWRGVNLEAAAQPLAWNMVV
ncbi:MAG TPA: DUF1848 domain-containing protein [Anaerolineae bacterium]|nr:DUF1848 domain-containing protein [Anaerolineae bacterium]